MARLDKDAARQMWLDGKTEREIAETFGVTVQAVRAVRKKYWEPVADALEPPEEPDAVQDCADGPVATDGTADAVSEDLDEDDSKIMIRALELMTGHLKGMDAVMTAQIVTALWDWRDKGDLLEVRNCLDYLIRRCEK